MANDYVPDVLNIMDVTEMAEKIGIIKETMPENMEKMEWDLELVVLHKALARSRTCVPGDTINPKLLCPDTKGCITCSAIQCTNELQKDRGGVEA
eukprot:12122973-Heterocapsa_arctica.AAC.1